MRPTMIKAAPYLLPLALGGVLVTLTAAEAISAATASRRADLPVPIRVPPAAPALESTMDPGGCTVLPDGLRICDFSASAAKPPPAPGRAFPRHTLAERPARAEAVRVVDWITRASGLARNFDILEADFKHNGVAFAATRRGRRVIVYDAAVFDWGESRVRWRHVAVMAHEIAHHLNGDTTGTHGAVHSHAQELAADHFAGFIVARLGGTEAQALSVADLLGEEASASHPGREERRQALARGWADGRAAGGLAS